MTKTRHRIAAWVLSAMVAFALSATFFADEAYALEGLRVTEVNITVND